MVVIAVGCLIAVLVFVIGGTWPPCRYSWTTSVIQHLFVFTWGINTALCILCSGNHNVRRISQGRGKSMNSRFAGIWAATITGGGLPVVVYLQWGT